MELPKDWPLFYIFRSHKIPTRSYWPPPCSADKNRIVSITFSATDNLTYNWSNISAKSVIWPFLEFCTNVCLSLPILFFLLFLDLFEPLFFKNLRPCWLNLSLWTGLPYQQVDEVHPRPLSLVHIRSPSGVAHQRNWNVSICSDMTHTGTSEVHTTQWMTCEFENISNRSSLISSGYI